MAKTKKTKNRYGKRDKKSHLVSREVDEELLFGEQGGTHSLEAFQHRGPVVLGLVEHFLHGFDVRHASLKLADVSVYGVPGWSDGR